MQFGAEPDQGKKPNVNRALWGWQYTSTGRVPGINGNADLDICYQDPAGTDETGTESGTIWCLFSPILFCAVTEKKKPITRAVISFFRIYHVLQMSRSSRNRTFIILPKNGLNTAFFQNVLHFVLHDARKTVPQRGCGFKRCSQSG